MNRIVHMEVQRKDATSRKSTCFPKHPSGHRCPVMAVFFKEDLPKGKMSENENGRA
ncbi:hypothetical protein MY8738_000622 [Beauveria namnaoensis]